jgi:hypothetical protein
VLQQKEELASALASEQERSRTRAEQALDKARKNLKAALLRARAEQGLGKQPDAERSAEGAGMQILAPGASTTENMQTEANAINAATDRSASGRRQATASGPAAAASSSSAGPKAKASPRKAGTGHASKAAKVRSKMGTAEPAFKAHESDSGESVAF